MDMEGFIGFVFGAVLFGFISGVLSYSNGSENIKDQAIAAQVACYKVDKGTKLAVFSWHCKETE